MKNQAPQSIAPKEYQIPLLAPVRIYTAKELAAMPLSIMNSCLEAQEKFAVLEQSIQMGGGCNQSPKIDGRRFSINSGNRKIQNALQNCWRILSTADYSAVGKAWFDQVAGFNMKTKLSILNLGSLNFSFAFLKSGDNGINVSKVDIDVNVFKTTISLIVIAISLANSYAFVVLINIYINFILLSYKGHFNQSHIVECKFTPLQWGLQGASEG